MPKAPSSAGHLPVDGEQLRAAMRHVPATVTIVTVGAPEPRGVTIASFSSVSLDPPLVSFNVQKGARVHPLIEAADRYAVHVLRSDQVALSDHFADPTLDGPRQFEGLNVVEGPDGLPILPDALAVFECEPWAVYDAGDHSLIVGRVIRVEALDEGEPVLYYQRSYRRVGEAIASRS